MTRKRCPKCGETKPLDDFHRRKRASDGRAARCKVCRRVGARAWYAANLERSAANNHRYRRKNLEKKAAYNREWRRKNPEKVAAEADKKRKRWPEKTRARTALQAAVYRGRLVKPDTCEGCEAKVDDPADLHGHHHDYSKPLAVEWLCRGCHSAIHSEGEAIHA